MAKVNQGRWTAEIEGGFVVFLIGPRPNSLWQLVKSFGDLGGRRGMNHMLKYLTEHPEKGLLGYQNGYPTIVQYWRSFGSYIALILRHISQPLSLEMVMTTLFASPPVYFLRNFANVSFFVHQSSGRSFCAISCWMPLTLTIWSFIPLMTSST